VDETSPRQVSPIRRYFMRSYNSFKKYSRFIYVIYIICAFLSYIYLGDHQDGRLALIWIIFVILAIVHFIEESAGRYFKWYNNFSVKFSILILVISFFYFIFTIPLQVYTLRTSSMVPTIYPRNIVVINKMAYRSNKPQRNDIALIKLDSLTTPVIHRIIACPNDMVKIENSAVIVNGSDIEFNTLYGASPETIVLKKDMYYHKGDNPNSYFDIISSDQILGKAVCIIGGKPK